MPDFCISAFLDFWIFVGLFTITWARRLQLQQSRDHSMIPKKSIILHKLMPLKGDKSLGGKEAKLISKPSAHINENLLTLSKIHASVLFSLMTKCINEICRDPFLKIPASTTIRSSNQTFFHHFDCQLDKYSGTYAHVVSSPTHSQVRRQTCLMLSALFHILNMICLKKIWRAYIGVASENQFASLTSYMSTT